MNAYTKGKGKSLSCVRLFATPWTAAYQAPPSWDFLGKNTGVGCHFLLQEIFLTQGLNPGLPYSRQTLYRLSHQGSLVILNWNLNLIPSISSLKQRIFS